LLILRDSIGEYLFEFHFLPVAAAGSYPTASREFYLEFCGGGFGLADALLEIIILNLRICFLDPMN